MSSIFLEGTVDADSINTGHLTGLPDSWLGTADGTTMSFPGLDASPYDTATSLHSPETPGLDPNTTFSSPITDFTYLDQPFGSLSPYTLPPATPGQFPAPVHCTTAPASLSEGYDLNSTTASPSLATVWPTHVSPAAMSFLPTPPMADELSPPSVADDDQAAQDAEPASPKEGTKKRKRAASTKADAKKQQNQLRTASRAPKKQVVATPRHPKETMEEVKARAAHNQVEQHYRKRLNTHFERLLEVLPAPGTEGGVSTDRRVSKAEVLDLARERIRNLERYASRLEKERRDLRGLIGRCIT